MWKKSFICLAVFLLAVSSAYSYPAWVYGKSKTQTVEVTEVTAEPEALPQEAQTVSEVSEETTLNETEPEAQEMSSKQESASYSETLKGQGANLVNSLKESKAKTAVVTQVSEYVDNVTEGAWLMEVAYNAEVANHEETEKAYNKLIKAKAFQVTLNPYAMYAPFSQTWGFGINTLYTYKGIGLSVGIEKPTLDFHNDKDLVVTAGLVFTF